MYSQELAEGLGTVKPTGGKTHVVNGRYGGGKLPAMAEMVMEVRRLIIVTI